MGGVSRRYAEWLVSITWKRFFVLSILLLIVAGILSTLPPFSWDLTTRPSRVPPSRSVDITVDENGVRIKPKKRNSPAPEITIDEDGVHIKRKGEPGKTSRDVTIDSTPPAPVAPAQPPQPPAKGSFADDIKRDVFDEIRREFADAQAEHADAQHPAADAKRQAAEARRQAAEARRQAVEARRMAGADPPPPAPPAPIRRDAMDSPSPLGNQERTPHAPPRGFLPQGGVLFIIFSAAVKIGPP